MPPSTRFPILRLPLVPLELIIKDLTPIDIFILAIVSNKIHEHLKRNPRKIDTFHLCWNRSQNEVCWISLNEEHPLQLRVWEKERAEANQNGIFDLKIDGKPYKAEYLNHFLSMLELYEVHENPKRSTLSQETVSSIFELLSDIFDIQKVCSDALSKEIVFPFISKYSGIQCLDLSHAISHLTSDDLSNLLENFSIEDFLLSWGVGRGVKYRKSLRYPKITIHRADWLTIDCLLNMDCASLIAYGAYLTVNDLKRFIQHWLDGGLEKLDIVELSLASRGISWESVTDNIEKKRLNKNDQMHWLLRHNGWEIKRSDGRRAGVYADKEFIFQVL